MKLPALFASAALLLCSSASAQSSSSWLQWPSERVMLWGGVGVYTTSPIYPAASLGVSIPVMQVAGVNVAPRLMADVVKGGGLVYVNLLLSSSQPGLKVYGGPEVGALPAFALMLGGSLGVRDEFKAAPHFGWFAEGHLRKLYAASTAGGFEQWIPSLRAGVTYRF